MKKTAAFRFRKAAVFTSRSEHTYKPSFVEYGNLSGLCVAAQLKPPMTASLTSSH